MMFFAHCLLATILHISQAGDRIDQEVHMQIVQAKPLQILEIEAKAIDQNGTTWKSSAFFQADEQGCVDVRAGQPLDGSSYSTVDGMGLFWSMTPVDGAANSFQCLADDYMVDITLRQEGTPVQQQSIRRSFKEMGVQKISVRENGLVGSLFIPQAEKPLPVIIALGGSSGIFDECKAKLLASSGFVVFALGYFGAEHLPPNLQDIPLEYFEKAFDYVKNHPAIDSSQIGLYGFSRGAELALLLGSVFQGSIQAIAAVSPSSVLYGSFSYPISNAWTYRGEAIVPYAPIVFTSEPNGKEKSNPANTRRYYVDGMLQKEVYESAFIPAEKIVSPLLLISGGDDQMWPSALYCEQILGRLQKAQSPIQRHHLHYPEAGHDINLPNFPVSESLYCHSYSQLWYTIGGTRVANAQASRDSWVQICKFFHDVLR